MMTPLSRSMGSPAAARPRREGNGLLIAPDHAAIPLAKEPAAREPPAARRAVKDVFRLPESKGKLPLDWIRELVNDPYDDSS